MSDFIIKTYKPLSEKFAISIPEIEGGWTICPNNNENLLALDSFGGDFSIIMQATPKEICRSDVNFAKFFEQKMNYYNPRAGEGTVIELRIDNKAVLNHITKVYEMENQGYPIKGKYTIFETEKAFYTCMIAGPAGLYNEYIGIYEKLYDYFEEL